MIVSGKRDLAAGETACVLALHSYDPLPAVTWLRRVMVCASGAYKWELMALRDPGDTGESRELIESVWTYMTGAWKAPPGYTWEPKDEEDVSRAGQCEFHMMGTNLDCSQKIIAYATFEYGQIRG